MVHVSHLKLITYQKLPFQLQSLLKCMGTRGAPRVLLKLVTLMFMNLGSIATTLDATEYFAGEMAAPWF